MSQRDQGGSAAYNDLPILAGDFRWRGVDYLVIRWPDDDGFDVVREDVPYMWRGKEVDEREP